MNCLQVLTFFGISFLPLYYTHDWSCLMANSWCLQIWYLCLVFSIFACFVLVRVRAILSLNSELHAYHYLIFLIPAEVIPGGELLGPLHHKVDEVTTAAKAAGDQKVSQDSEEPPQVNVLILLVLLLVDNRLLKQNRRQSLIDHISTDTTLQMELQLYTVQPCLFLVKLAPCLPWS